MKPQEQRQKLRQEVKDEVSEMIILGLPPQALEVEIDDRDIYNPWVTVSNFRTHSGVQFSCVITKDMVQIRPTGNYKFSGHVSMASFRKTVNELQEINLLLHSLEMKLLPLARKYPYNGSL